MFRSSRLSFAKPDVKTTTETEKQKQKKRLSFKDPEVEQNSNKARSPDLLGIPSEDPALHKRSSEDLTLEDRSSPSGRCHPDVYPNLASTLPKSFDHLERGNAKHRPKRNLSASVAQKDLSIEETRPRHKGKMKYNVEEEQNYSKALEPMLPDNSSMRCPIIELTSEESSSPTKGSGATAFVMNCEGRIAPTTAYHQIQMLNYQLEQQRQQTQTALHQIQLLNDHLSAESATRYKAQVQNHQIMLQNKELVNHIQQLFQQIEELESYIESRDQRPSSPQVQEQRPQATCSYNAPMQLGYHRNSLSTQSLWSNPSHLSVHGLANRSNSSTALTTPSAESCDSSVHLADVGRRQSIQDQPVRISSPYDADWRMRRRGSSSFYSPLEPTKTRNGKLNDNVNTPKDAASETKTVASGKTEVDPTIQTKKGNILIVEDFASTECTRKEQEGSWSNRYFKPITDETQSSQIYTKWDKQGSSTSKTTTSHDTPKKLAKSLEALRLFNS